MTKNFNIAKNVIDPVESYNNKVALGFEQIDSNNASLTTTTINSAEVNDIDANTVQINSLKANTVELLDGSISCTDVDITNELIVDTVRNLASTELKVVSDTIHYENTLNGTIWKISEEGFVTVPYRPYCRVYFNGGLQETEKKAVSAPLSVKATNPACYNTATHRFIAPVDGLYALAAQCTFKAAPTISMLRLVINGEKKGIGYKTGVIWTTVSVNEVYNLKANDYVEWWYLGDPQGGNDWFWATHYLI